MTQQWKPIESAPKDGSEIWTYNGEQARMRWIEGGCYALWIWADDLLSDADPNPDAPTHWMPLPAAPGTPPASAQDDAKDERERGPVDVLEIARATGLRSYLHGVNAMEARMLLQRFVDALPVAPAAGDAAQVARWKRDSELLMAVQDSCWDVRFLSHFNGDDCDISIEIVGHYMAAPHERVMGENYNENLRAALEQALTADAYPPARPEYDEHGRPVIRAASQQQEG